MSSTRQIEICAHAGADVDAVTALGQATPLHRAAYMGHTPVLQCLCVPYFAQQRCPSMFLAASRACTNLCAFVSCASFKMLAMVCQQAAMPRNLVSSAMLCVVRHVPAKFAAVASCGRFTPLCASCYHVKVERAAGLQVKRSVHSKMMTAIRRCTRLLHKGTWMRLRCLRAMLLQRCSCATATIRLQLT